MFHNRRLLNAAVRRPFVASGGGPAFPSLTGLVGRWRANDPGIVGTTTITSVPDSSGNSLTLSNSGGAVALNPTGYNGHPAFQFTATNNGALVRSSFPIGTGNKATVAFVGQMLTGTESYGGAVAYAASGQNDYNGTGSALFFGRNGASNGIDSRADTLWVDNFSNITLATNYRFLLTYDGDDTATGCKVYINNSLTTTTGAPGLNTFLSGGLLAIGGRVTAGAIDYTGWDGLITEVVFCTAVLTTTERNNLDTYFTGTWGS